MAKRKKLLMDYKFPEDFRGQGGLLKEPNKAFVEQALDRQLTHYLGYPGISIKLVMAKVRRAC